MCAKQQLALGSREAETEREVSFYGSHPPADLLLLLPVCRWLPLRSCRPAVSTFLKTCNPFQPFNLLTFNFIRSHRARPPGRSGNARQTRCFQPFNFFFKRFTRFNLFNFFNRYFNPGPRPKPEAEARLVSTFNFFQRYSFQPLTFSNVYSFSTL